MLRKRKHHLKNKVKYTECREPMQEDKQTRSPLLQRVKQLQEYVRERNISKKAVTLAVAVLVLAGLAGVKYREDGTLLPTSSGVGKKELPIYCVQTEEPKIALTFDAAWGNNN